MESSMSEEDDVVADDEKRLEDLDEEIKEGRQHLKEITHEGEHYFLEDEESGPAAP
jgi:hypothetical protein